VIRKAKAPPVAAAWKNRITSFEEVDPRTVVANPLNFRTHPAEQREALQAVMERVGVIAPVIINRASGRLVDGHLRLDMALQTGQTKIHAAFVDLTDEEEAEALATFDAVGDLAGLDDELLRDLLRDMKLDDDRLAPILAELGHAMPKSVLFGLTGENDATTTLAERFGVPPFSILDTRQGYWQDRKRAWISLGLKSEVGRGDNLLKLSATLLEPDRAKRMRGKVFNTDEGSTSSTANGISGNGTSIFDPVLAELAYRWFCPPGGIVFDPFAGGSVRGIVAAMLGRRYTGIELRSQQVEANRVQGADILGGQAYPTPEWICGDSLRMDEHLPRDFEADMILSCPPYVDLEVYSDDPADISNKKFPDFMPVYADIIRKAVSRLKPNSFIVWVVGEVRNKAGNYHGFVPGTIRIFEEAGASFYNEGILVNAVGTAALRAGGMFEKSRKLCKVHQNVLVFVKGDAKKATKAIGKVEAGNILDLGDPDAQV